MRDHKEIDTPSSLHVVIIDDHVMFAEGVAASLRATGEVSVDAIAPTAEAGEAGWPADSTNATPKPDS